MHLYFMSLCPYVCMSLCLHVLMFVCPYVRHSLPIFKLVPDPGKWFCIILYSDTQRYLYIYIFINNIRDIVIYKADWHYHLENLSIYLSIYFNLFIYLSSSLFLFSHPSICVHLINHLHFLLSIFFIYINHLYIYIYIYIHIYIYIYIYI